VTAAGDLYVADLGGGVGHEQRGIRPVLSVSDEAFTAPGLLFAVPLTTTDRGLPHHIAIPADQVTGLQRASFAMTEQTRALSVARLVKPKPIGRITPATLAEVRLWLARQIGL
jgi:mRNA interferase MazF